MNDETLIDDQFQFVMGIASGSSSTVEEVVEKGSGRHLAMKRLKQDVPEFKENKAQLKRESQVLKSLDHPLIVKFVGYSSNRDHTYMLMEHFRAANLKVQIKADLNKIHLRIRQLLEGICSALSHVHQRGFVHRDIKPDNVLMNKAGEVRLCDFSLSSKQATGMGKMFAGKLKTIQGTRTYIAPETIRKRQPTFQTDMYSLGILFFELLTGKTPFQAPTPEELLNKHLKAEPPNPSEFNPNVSPEMDRIVAKLLKKKPADRPASIEEVLTELRRIRIFKEDVVDAEAAKKANEDADALAMLSEIRLDSRADAKLKHMLETNPEFAKKYVAEMQTKERKKKVEADKLRQRVEAAEAKGKKSPAKGKDAPPAAAAVPQTIAVPVPVPMPMPGFAPGYPGYPPGYGGYPHAQMPMMPMQPPMGMPGQYAPQPQMGYPQAAPQQAMPPQVQQVPPQRMQTAEPPARPQSPAQAAPAAPPQTAQAAPPVRMSSAAPPVRMATEAPPAAPVKQPAAHPQQVAKQQGAKPTARQAVPAQANQNPAAPQTPAKSVGPLPGRTPVKPAPPPEVAADLDFMTDLPDVL